MDASPLPATPGCAIKDSVVAEISAWPTRRASRRQEVHGAQTKSAATHRPTPLSPAMTRKLHSDEQSYSDVFETNGSGVRSIGELAERICSSGASLIALDGCPGAGKSTLAARLSARLTIRTVRLDDYLVPEPTGFLDFLAYEELQRALLRRPVIVEGVCMLDVLDRLDLRPDQLVYLRAPLAERHLDRSHPLVREVRAYADRRRPMERADLFLTRAEHEPNKYETHSDRGFCIDAWLTRNRSHISLGLTAAGIIMLAIGAISVVVGSTALGGSLTDVAAGDFSLVGLGSGIMLTSSIWIFLARLALPRTRIHGSPRAKE